MPQDERPAEQYEWIWESRSLAEYDPDKLRELVELAAPGSADHAYTSRDLGELRKILKLSKTQWPDSVLHFHTDRFAVIIGLNLRLMPRVSPGSRKRQIARSLIGPASALRDNLRRHSDLIVSDNATRESTRKITRALDAQLSAFIEVARLASEQIVVRKGARWDTEFKRYYVQVVTMLCEYLNNDFEPTRVVDSRGEGSSAFQAAVAILAGPLPFQDQLGKTTTFDGAIREMVDTWNSNKRALVRKIRAAEPMEKNPRR